jgi:hypothetical protein
MASNVSSPNEFHIKAMCDSLAENGYHTHSISTNAYRTILVVDQSVIAFGASVIEEFNRAIEAQGGDTAFIDVYACFPMKESA